MLIFTGLVTGAAFGAFNARRQGGKFLDMLQYGSATGIALGLLGWIASVAITRL